MPLAQAAAAEQVLQCDAPKNTGWRPGARWAREEVARQVAALPAHQRPPMREMGRRSEAAEHPFRAMKPNEGARPIIARPDPEDVPNTRWRGFDGLDPNADDRAAAALARWRAMPSVRYPGEGPHPDKHARRGSNDAGAAVPGVAAFFDTGRTTARAVALTCPPPSIRPDASDGRGPVAMAPRPTAKPHTNKAHKHEVREVSPPLVTVQKTGSRIEIAAASPEARALGLAPGMALTQARALVPELDIRDADSSGDCADLMRFATALARRWCPVVAIADDETLFLDITGTAHLHGGEAAFAKRLHRLLTRLGITAQVAIADTAGAAWALSRHNQIQITPPGEHRAAIAPLPIAALRLDEPARDLLARLGVDTIGQLAAMPRAPLVRRFGKTIANRLDQATGAAPEPLDPIVPPQPIAVERRFAEPIATAEAIGHWLAGLVTELTVELTKVGRGARALAFVAARVDSTDQVIRIGLARASRDPAHLLRLIARRIEEIEVGYGVDALTLHLTRADPLGPESFGEALAEQQTPDLAPLVDTLANRIGASRLWRHQPVESDVPERSVATRAPLDPPAAGTLRLKRDDVRQLDRSAADHPWHVRWPRPTRLLRRPEPVDHVMAELPDHAPVRFTWRGRRHVVIHADGPERITGEWWLRRREREAVRDYFRVEDEHGRRYWLFRRGDGLRAETGDLSWYIHGTFA